MTSSVISAVKGCKVLGAVPNPVSTDLSSSTMLFTHFVEHHVEMALSTSSAPQITGSRMHIGALGCPISNVDRAMSGLSAGVGGEGADEDVGGAEMFPLPELRAMVVAEAAAATDSQSGCGGPRQGGRGE